MCEYSTIIENKRCEIRTKKGGERMIAENLKYFRHKAGLTQEAVAAACKVSRANVSKWESGEFSPTINKLVVLAELLGVTTDDLLKNQLAFNAKQSD